MTLIRRWELLQETLALVEANDNIHINQSLIIEVVYSINQGFPTDKLGRLIAGLSERLLNNRFTNLNPEDRKDMIQEGIAEGLKYYKHFNFSKSSNVYAYMVQVIKGGHLKIFTNLIRNKKRGL